MSSRQPFGARVAGVDVVAGRDQQHRLCVGPPGCPHLGADLATGTVHGGRLICRWHGLALAAAPGSSAGARCPATTTARWSGCGSTKWAGRHPPEAPAIPARPTGDTLAAVARLVGVCEPTDIVANRLDPWHGAWLHPYSFTRLEVLTTPTEHADHFLVAVTFRIGRLGIPVIAKFTCPTHAPS